VNDFFYLLVMVGVFYSLFRGLFTVILKVFAADKLKVRQDYSFEPYRQHSITLLQ
jgi:hypothetical protein